MTRSTTLSLAAIAIALCTPMTQAFAEDEYNVSTGVTLDGVPLGVHGVDTVALATYNAVAEGDAMYTVIDDGIAYYFASEKTARLFKDNPGRYKPKYGGYCAYAVALGKKLDGDPYFADIVDGNLYLFVNRAVFEKYKQNKVETLRKAEEIWPTIKHAAVEDLL